MNKLIATLITTLFASATFADVAQPETPGSEGPKAVAEANHLARQHGLAKPVHEVEAQTTGDARAQAVAETIHLGRTHGNVNDSANQRLEKDHPNH